MNKIVFSWLLTMILGEGLLAQKIEKFYDYKWNECPANEARFYSYIENTDSGWVRFDYFLAEKKLQMKGKYKDSTRKISDGYFYFFHSNGVIQSTGQYLNNKKNGLWLGFYPDKTMSDSTFYDSGNPKGTSIQWHTNGFMSDSTVYIEDGKSVAVSWFDDGTVSSAGRLNILHEKTGKWQYFHKTGKLSADEIYDNGVLIDRKYVSEDGITMTDTTNKSHPAQYPGGIPKWTKYLERNLYFPPNYKIVNGDKAVVVMVFTVDENGNVKDVVVETPFFPAFDEIALKVIKNSPKWIPAIDHNRNVKYHHKQTVSFNQISN